MSEPRQEASGPPPGYRFVVPERLPRGEEMKMCLFLHCDVNEHYDIRDFRQPLEEIGVLGHVAALGVFVYSHLWLLKLKTDEAKEVLVTAGSLRVKGRHCAVLGADCEELWVKVHCVPYHATNESLRAEFERFAHVKCVSRGTWSLAGFEGVESTTRHVRMCLKPGVTREELPHAMPLCDTTVLVVVPGRPPMCVRCRRTGHSRRLCLTPLCNRCRAFGHVSQDCVISSARASAQANEDALQYLVDQDVMEVILRAERDGEVGAEATGVTIPDAARVASRAVEDTAEDRGGDLDVSDATLSDNDRTSSGAEKATSPSVSGKAPLTVGDNEQRGTEDASSSASPEAAASTHQPKRRISEEEKDDLQLKYERQHRLRHGQSPGSLSKMSSSFRRPNMPY
nr:uncharacterized protein LOC129381470 [Dermacentor andersoni]